ncbi:MFS transporter [Phenylobacterium immobile]|uniref:MFS transporter n=1 Tax=Phenylobacterium immobile TaxID=21 RepID=UPI000B1419AF|nr:MFS transporter [Phenylobacterium immobile]
MTQARVSPLALRATILLLSGLEFLHAGAIAFAAGPIMGEIAASPEEFSMTTAGYAAVAVLTIAKQRWLVERLGWRRYVQLSLVVFSVGAVICANSRDFGEFLLGRCVMGLGGAAFMTSARVMVQHIAPGPGRFGGIKFFASGLAAGIALAPGLAALAVAHDSWNAIFYVLAALAMIAALLASFALPTETVALHERSQSHPVLAAALAGGSFLLLFVLQRLQYDIYANLWLLLLGLGAATLLLGHAFRAMRRHQRPLLALSALAQSRYLTGVAIYFVCYVTLGANNYMLPVLMQRTLGFAWQVVGGVQSLGLAAALATWFILSQTFPRWPKPKKYFVIGFLALAGFGWRLSTLTLEADLSTQVLPALALNGAFLMLLMATTAAQTFRDFQHDEAIMTNAQQLKNMVGQLGTAVGVAFATLLLQWRTAEHYTALNNRFSLASTAYNEANQALANAMAPHLAAGQASAAALAMLAQQLAQQAGLMACLDYFALIAVVGVVGAAVMGLQRVME